MSEYDCTECCGSGIAREPGYYVPGEQFVEPPSEDMCGACLGTGSRAVQEIRADRDRLRARVAELEAAGSVSPDDAHTTTETRNEWRVIAITPMERRSTWVHDSQQRANDHAAHLRRWRWDGVTVDSRTVSTTTRTTAWKGETP